MSPTDARRIQRVLLLVLLLNLAVSAAKFIGGQAIGSIAMQADGLHSLVDGLSNVVGLVGIWLAARPPDANHPYGHRKYETLASIAIGAMLLYTTVEILRGAIDRLLGGGQPEVNALAFGIMLVTMAINIGVATWETRVGRALGSDVLLADATQTRGDVYVSSAVIGGLVATLAGFPQLDALVALAVAVVVGHAAWQVLRRASGVLSDEAALPHRELDDLVRSVAGVSGTHRLRTRGHQTEVFVDLDIKVDAGLTVEQGHALAHEVRARVLQRWPAIKHMMVHVEPVAPASSQAIQRIHYLAGQRHLNVHEVEVRATRTGQAISFHLEVDPALTLGEAHALAEELEEAIRADLPRVRSVASHIEARAATVEHHEEVTSSQPGLVARVEDVANGLVGAGRCHAVQVYRHGEGASATYDLVMHCTLPAALPLDVAHQQAEQVELALRQAVPGLGTVTVHAEPPDEGRGELKVKSDEQ